MLEGKHSESNKYYAKYDMYVVYIMPPMQVYSQSNAVINEGCYIDSEYWDSASIVQWTIFKGATMYSLMQHMYATQLATAMSS